MCIDVVSKGIRVDDVDGGLDLARNTRGHRVRPSASIQTGCNGMEEDTVSPLGENWHINTMGFQSCVSIRWVSIRWYQFDGYQYDWFFNHGRLHAEGGLVWDCKAWDALPWGDMDVHEALAPNTGRATDRGTCWYSQGGGLPQLQRSNSCQAIRC